MNQDFARIMTLLRKEKKLSQKQVAQDLGVSQALLSHYEKGIRECGLDFVIKAAEYYSVSCDYLLGRTAERELEVGDSGEGHSNAQTTYHLMSRRLIAAALSVIYDLLARSGSRRLTRAVTACLMIGLYRVFRMLYGANQKNPEDLFTVPRELYQGYSEAAQIKLTAEIGAICSDTNHSSISPNTLHLSPETLAQDYPAEAAALFNVIQQSENSINRTKK